MFETIYKVTIGINKIVLKNDLSVFKNSCGYIFIDNLAELKLAKQMNEVIRHLRLLMK